MISLIEVYHFVEGIYPLPKLKSWFKELAKRISTFVFSSSGVIIGGMFLAGACFGILAGPIDSKLRGQFDVKDSAICRKDLFTHSRCYKNLILEKKGTRIEWF